MLKSALLSAALVAGTVAAAQAQSNNVAALPPSAPPAATAPSYGAYPGPNPGGSWAGVGHQTQQIVPSQAYVGPSPGGSNGAMPPHFDKPAGWDQNAALHPYTTSGSGPRPN
jgi:hypothetical protein